jgi:hypothetical protein
MPKTVQLNVRVTPEAMKIVKALQKYHVEKISDALPEGLTLLRDRGISQGEAVEMAIRMAAKAAGIVSGAKSSEARAMTGGT